MSGQMSALLDGNGEGRVWGCPVYVQYVGACVAHALRSRVHTTDEMADQAIGPCDSFFGWTILDGFCLTADGRCEWRFEAGGMMMCSIVWYRCGPCCWSVIGTDGCDQVGGIDGRYRKLTRTCEVPRGCEHGMCGLAWGCVEHVRHVWRPKIAKR